MSEASVQFSMGLLLGPTKAEYIMWVLESRKRDRRELRYQYPLWTIPNCSSDFSIARFYCLINWYHTFSTWVIDRHPRLKLWHWISTAILKYAKKSQNTKKKWIPIERPYSNNFLCVLNDPFSQTIQVGSRASIHVFWEYTIQYTVTKNSRETTIFWSMLWSKRIENWNYLKFTIKTKDGRNLHFPNLIIAGKRWQFYCYVITYHVTLST